VALPPLGSHDQITLEAWIKPDFFDEFNAIFTTDEWQAGSLHFQLIDDEMIALSLNAGDDENGDGQDEDAVFGGPGIFEPGEWRHVAVTYNSADSTAILYVNGAAAGTNVFSIPPVTADLLVSHIGAWNGDERFYYGLMDEFAIYDHVLSPERVRAHYEAAAGVSVARPEISVSRSASQLTLSWTGSGFTLEETADLSSPGWQPVSGVTGNSVSVSIEAGNKFFRLRHP
jgi:hypothetical protein